MILTALCGHGHLDLAAYDAYLAGQLDDRHGRTPTPGGRGGADQAAGPDRDLRASMRYSRRG